MRRVVFVVLVILMALTMALPASADRQGPCNNDETGRDYAKHHITEFAKDGDLGNGGHKPGTHMGFSTCLGVHP